MELNCGISQCLFYSAITVVLLIVIILITDIILYFAYSYFRVRRYYSADIRQWRDAELAKYGYVNPGTVSSDWEEIVSPDEDQQLAQIIGNKSWLWSVGQNGNVYVCKKPCNGTSDDTFWTKFPGTIKNLSVNENTVWGVLPNNAVNTITTTNNKGTWKPVKKLAVTNIAISPTKAALWATDKKSQPIYLNARGKWILKPLAGTVKIAPGNTWTWSLTANGSVYITRIDGSTGWTQVKTPDTVKLLAVGLKDNPYIVTKDGTLFTCTQGCTTSQPVWSAVKGAPKFSTFSVNSEIYGVDGNGTVWTSAVAA